MLIYLVFWASVCWSCIFSSMGSLCVVNANWKSLQARLSAKGCSFSWWSQNFKTIIFKHSCILLDLTENHRKNRGYIQNQFLKLYVRSQHNLISNISLFWGGGVFQGKICFRTNLFATANWLAFQNIPWLYVKHCTTYNLGMFKKEVIISVCLFCITCSSHFMKLFSSSLCTHSHTAHTVYISHQFFKFSHEHYTWF